MKTPHQPWAAFGLSILLGLLTILSARSQITPFIESGETWRVLDNGTATVANWKTSAFNDNVAGWRSLPGSFGYKVESPSTYNSNGATSILNFNAGNVIATTSKYITTYFRKTFSLPSGSTPSQFAALFLNLRYDDGVVVYLNGTELRRENMAAGVPTAATLALVANNVIPFTSTVFSLASPNNALLLATNNVLAVELHQAAASSSDIFLDVALSGLTSIPSFGNATPGVAQSFDIAIEPFDNNDGYYSPPNYPPNYDYYNHFGYRRNPLEPTDDQLQYEIYTTLISTPGGNYDGLQPQSIPNAGSYRLRFQKDTDNVLNTERIDIRNYTNVKGYIDIRSQNVSTWGANDYLRGTVLYSTDGKLFDEVPWFNYQTAATTSQPHVLVDTNSPFHWLVPTISSAVANTTTNPTVANWTSLTPTATGGPAWTNYTTPPNLSVNTVKTWHAGNLPASAIKGGIGFDRQTTTGVDYTPYLDSGSSAQTNTESSTVETRVNVRYPFTIPAGSLTGVTITKIELQVRFDDAFSAWLNGTLLTSEAAPTTDTTFPAARDDATCTIYKTYDVTTIALPLLRSGSGGLDPATGNNNVLALRGYNASTTSSDLLLGARLIYYTPTPQPFDPASLQLANGAMLTLDTGSLVPPNARSMKLRIVSHIASTSDKYFLIDNVRFAGDATVATNLGTTLDLQLPSASYPLSRRATTADADGDGIINMLEYAFGSDASISAQSVVSGAGSGQSFAPVVTNLPDGRVAIQCRTFSSPDATFADSIANGFLDIRDLRYRFQYSPYLDDGWNEGVFTFDGLPSSKVQNDDGTQYIKIITASQILSQNERYFFRVKVDTLRSSWINEVQDGSLFPDPF